jgi:hypothetical protein
MQIGREIRYALAFKLLALVALYLLFFGPAHRAVTTPDGVAAHLMGPR